MEVTNRQKHDLEQGSQAWLDARSSYLSASDAPTVCGFKGKQAYLDLVHREATGEQQVFSDHTLAIFAKGHEYEALARPDAEEWLQGALSNDVFSADVTYNGSSYSFMASLDGLTGDGKHAWECKTLNNKIRGYKTVDDIGDEYKAQMTIQMLCSGAEAVLFTGANDKDIEHIGLYKFDPEFAEKIMASYEKFISDVLNYEPSQDEDPELIKLLNEYRQTKEVIDEQSKILKALESEIKAKADGKDQVKCAGYSITKQVRKGSIDYGSIPELEAIDLEQYRKPETEYYTIKEMKK